MILVVGSTGMVGGHIARGLLELGHDVRILVRAPSDYQALVEAGAEPVIGDLKERRSLDTACQGIEVVVTTANSAQRGGDDTVESVDLKGNANLIEAAVDAGVRRFVFVSAFGVSPDSPVPFMAAKAITEARLRDSGMEWTILAPEAFMEVWLGMVVTGPALSGGDVVYVGSGDRRHSFVSLIDVAKLAVAAVDSPAAKDRYIPIAGPKPISFNDAAEAFERALGRPIPRRSVPAGVPIPGMPETVLALLTGLDAADSIVDTSAEAKAFGIRQTSLDDYVASVVPVAV